MNKDPFQYVYPKGTKVEISGDTFYAIMQILQQVKVDQTLFGFADTYTKNIKETKGEDGVTPIVNVELEKHPSALSFFSQPQQTFTTLLGSIALDTLMVLQTQHLANVEDGIAVEVGTVQKPEKNVIKLA